MPHREVFAEETRSNHKQFLFRRIAWRTQANTSTAWCRRSRPIPDRAAAAFNRPRNGSGSASRRRSR